jgi:hypothetical protein
MTKLSYANNDEKHWLELISVPYTFKQFSVVT